MKENEVSRLLILRRGEICEPGMDKKMFLSRTNKLKFDFAICANLPATAAPPAEADKR